MWRHRWRATTARRPSDHEQAYLCGGYAGARLAVSRGAGFVRVFFIVVVSAFIIRIGGQVVGLW